MYEGYECQILHEGKLTEPIQINSGVRQGCILSPALFLLVLDGVMRKVMEKRRRGLQCGLQDRLKDIDFEDDICLLSQRYRDMEIKLVKLLREAEDARLKINVNLTKEMRINSDIEHSLSINGKDIEQVESFLYLGSVVTEDGGAKEDARNRIRKANGAFVQLYLVWKNRNISRKTKLRLFNSNVKSVLLYGCETWKVTNRLPTSCKFSLIAVYDVLLIGDGRI
jgi:hypothetical protein